MNTTVGIYNSIQKAAIVQEKEAEEKERKEQYASGNGIDWNSLFSRSDSSSAARARRKIEQVKEKAVAAASAVETSIKSGSFENIPQAVESVAATVQEAAKDPKLLMQGAAEILVEKVIGKLVDKNVAEACKKYGIILNGGLTGFSLGNIGMIYNTATGGNTSIFSGQSTSAAINVIETIFGSSLSKGMGNLSEEQRDIIRNTIRGTKDSIFRNPDLRAEMLNKAYGQIEKYVNGKISEVAGNLGDKILKPLGSITSGVDSAIDKVDSVISSGIDKLDSFLGKIDQYDIAKTVCDKIADYMDNLDISSKVTELTGKLSGIGNIVGISDLGSFGFGDSEIKKVTESIGATMGGYIQKVLPSLESNIKKLHEFSTKIKSFMSGVKSIKNAIKNQINEWKDKAKAWVQDKLKSWAGQVLSGTSISLGGFSFGF